MTARATLLIGLSFAGRYVVAGLMEGKPHFERDREKGTYGVFLVVTRGPW